MSPNLAGFWFKRLSLIFISLLISFAAFSKDASDGRAEAMAKISEDDIASQTLRYKIIQSRMLILYMMDFLPFKGNPYFHMAEFASQTTLPAFKEAQRATSPFMDSETPYYWLPVETGQTLSADSMKDLETMAVIKYFAQYVATAELLETTIQPILKSSIIIGSIEETAGFEASQKFSKTWRFIKHYSDRYKALLMAHPGSEDQVKTQNKKVTLLIMGSIAKGMRPFVPYVETPSNKKQINDFLTTIENVADDSVTPENLSDIKSKLSALTNPENQTYKSVVDSLETVDLPETGSIDGAEEAFEVAMRLEVGFDVLQKLISNINETW